MTASPLATCRPHLPQGPSPLPTVTDSTTSSASSPSSAFCAETRRRRTFAIISHPDAGKTTLTEKLLLFSGAIHIAGAVKGR